MIENQVICQEQVIWKKCKISFILKPTQVKTQDNIRS